VEWGALTAACAALIAGVLTWTQSRASNRRADFIAIMDRMDRELQTEREQRRLLMSFLLELLRWARTVELNSQADPPPDPPAELDLAPWLRP